MRIQGWGIKEPVSPGLKRDGIAGKQKSTESSLNTSFSPISEHGPKENSDRSELLKKIRKKIRV